jgi:pyrroloquinoline quinone biosynthesis protein E
VYCSNPLDYDEHASGLPTETWQRIFTEAEQLGVVQLNLTGGEPLVRRDLESLVKEARRLNLYTNLITSGVPLTRERLVALREAGLDSLQLSFQGLDAEISQRIAGRDAFAHKLEVAAWVRELRIPLTLNFVIHRHNIADVSRIVEFAERLHADRLELANAQYLGFALLNRDALLPSREQLASAREAAHAAKERLKGKMEVLFVLADYYGKFPRACMDGWGRRYLVVSPDGLVLPCQFAHTIPSITFDNAAHQPLAEIWQNSLGLNQFRGDAWMPEPCRSCDRKQLDFGGCRCQAYHLTGDVTATDPACSLAPRHDIIESARDRASENAPAPELQYRSPRRALPVV